jgi:diacylglycerol O-acyltransferase
MTGMDAAFLYAETPTMHLQTLGIIELDSPADGRGFSAEDLVRVIESRIHLLPALRRRAVSVPAGIDHPVWIEDPAFVVADHVYAYTLPAPGSHAELEAFVGRVASTPIDRRRPLWEMWVVDGLDGVGDGNFAIVAKLHHSIMDGAGGAEMLATLFDFEPSPPPSGPPEEPWQPDELPRWTSLVSTSLSSLAARQAKVPQEIAATLSNLAGTVRTWVGQRVAGTGGQLTAPRTPFNGSLCAERVVSLHHTSLEDVLFVKNTFGVKVNDVILAASAMALYGYLEARGAAVDRPLVAAVPVAVGGAKGEPGFGNDVSAMLVPLPHPVAGHDPGDRLWSAHENANAAKQLQIAYGPEMLRHLTGFVAPAVLAGFARLYSGLGLAGLHPPVANLVISNVAGPPIELYLAGARLRAAYPLGPVMEGMGVNITVLSVSNELDIGIIADAQLVDDVGELGDRLVQALGDLCAAAVAAKGPAAAP